jgi:CRP/FNR family transcriptional regulator, cyclic AMP receptor protein
MELTQFLTHPLFKKSMKRYELGERLFNQGQPGDTMFIILEGKVRLLSDDQGRQYTIAIMGQGQFIGEKALVADHPYERHFTAQAITPVLALQLGKTELLEVQKQSPYLMKLILTRSFEMAEERLDRANRLARVLRSSCKKTRFAKLIEYLAETIGRKEAEGIRVSQLADHIYYHIDMERSQIETDLKDLVVRGLLQKKDEDYLIPSVEALIAVVAVQSPSPSERALKLVA